MNRRRHIVRALLAAAWITSLTGCSGTLPGVPEDEEAPRVARRASRLQTLAPPDRPELASEPSEPPASAVAPAPASYALGPSEAPPPAAAVGNDAGAATLSFDARDRQFEIMAEAVMALREELARSYEHSQQLAQEVSRLRAVVSSLRQELARNKGESGTLRNHVRALEKKLHEIEPSAPARTSSSEPVPRAPAQPAPAAPVAPAPPPPPPPAASAPAARSAPAPEDALPADQIPDDDAP